MRFREDHKKQEIFAILAITFILVGMVLLLNDPEMTGKVIYNLDDTTINSIDGEVVLGNGGSIYLDLENESFVSASFKIRGNATDIVVDILADGVEEFSSSDLGEATIFGFEKELNDYINNCGVYPCNVPIFVQGDGEIILYDMQLETFDVSEETFISDEKPEPIVMSESSSIAAFPASQGVFPAATYDTSGGDINPVQVNASDDVKSIYIAPKDTINDSRYQEFVFSLDYPDNLVYDVVNITLESLEDPSIGTARLDVYDVDEGVWESYPLNPGTSDHIDIVDIIASINSTQEVNNLSVRYLAASSGNNKQANIDLVVLNIAARDIASPDVSLSYPSDGHEYYNISSANVTFNCSASENDELKNVSLYLTDSSNQSLAIVYTEGSSQRNYNLSKIIELGEGDYSWRCGAYDVSENYGLSDLRSFEITGIIVQEETRADSFSPSYGSTNFSTVDVNNVSNLTLATSYGNIDFSGRSVNATGEDYDSAVKIRNGFISVNTSGLHPSFNGSAQLSLDDMPCASRVYYGEGIYDNAKDIIAEGNVCNATTDPSCIVISCGSSLVFNVSHFTGYAVQGDSNLTIWDDTDYGEKTSAEPIGFYANYTNGSVAIDDANCTINFSDGTNIMMWNEGLGLYEYTRGFPSGGIYWFNISCNRTGYPSLDANDTVNVSANYPPQWFDNRTDITPYYKNGVNSQFNISWSDDISTVFIETNHSGAQNYTINNISGDVYSYSIQLNAGTYYWKSYANDSSNQWNESDTWIFTVDKEDASATLDIAPGLNVVYGQNVTVQYFESNEGDGDVTYRIYRNGTEVGEEDVILAYGDYIYVLNTTGGNNYNSNSSLDTKVVSVSRADPNVDLRLGGFDSNITVEPFSYVNISGTYEAKQGNISLFNDTLLNTSDYQNITHLIYYDTLGDYPLFLVYNQTENYSQSSEEHYVLVKDNTDPIIDIKTPLASDIVGWTVIFMANVTDNYDLENVTYEISNTTGGGIVQSGVMEHMSGDMYNITMVTNDSWPYDRDSSQGLNLTFTVYVNDSSLNMQTESVQFILDNSRPGIQFINPQSNGSFYNSDFNMNVWLSNTYLNYTNYTIRNISNGVVMQESEYDFTGTVSQLTDLVNGSVLAEGNYTLYVYLRDYIGNENNKTTEFYIDRTLPNITLKSSSGWIDPTPINNTFTENTSIVANFTCNDSYLAAQWIDLNGVINYNLDNSGNAYWWNFTRTEALYTYTGYCNDSAGNVAATEERTITIDYNDPNVQLTQPSDERNFSSTSVGFRWRATDNVDPVMQCNLTIDGIINISNVSSANGVNIPTQTVNGLSEWWHYWNVTCIDDLNHTRTSETRRFITDITKPFFWNYSPVREFNYSYNNPTFNFNISDNLPFNAQCYLRIDGNFVDSNLSVYMNESTNLTSSIIGNGLHNWSIYCNDSSGNWNESETRNFTVDTTYPIVSIEQPIENDFLADDVQIFANVTDSVTKIYSAWYNVTNASNFDQIVYTEMLYESNEWDAIWNSTGYPDGNYTIFFYGNDSAGNVNSNNVTIEIDTNNTGIQFIYPIDDRYFNYSFNLDIIVNDPTLNFTSINITNETGDTIYYNSKNISTNRYNWTDLVDKDLLLEGNFTLNVSARDYYGAEFSKVYWFMMDIEQPRLFSFISNDTDNITRADAQLNFTVDILDKFADNITISGYQMSNVGHEQTAYAIRQPNQLGCSAEGSCTLAAIALDYLHNEMNENYTITIDNNAPIVSLNYPVEYYNTSSSSILFNWTATDTIDPNLTCNVTIDNLENWTNVTSMAGISEVRNTTGFSEGHHLWNVTCADEIPHSTTSFTRRFVNDYTNPSEVVLNAPIHRANISSTSVQFDWTVSDNLDPVPRCNLSISGIVNRSDVVSPNDTATQVIVNGFSEGHYEWNMTCFDSAANENISVTREFLIDRTGPGITLNLPGRYANESKDDITFNWTTVDLYDPELSCNLSVDNQFNISYINQTNSTLISRTVSSFAEGHHVWDVSCADDSGNRNFSLTRNLLIDRTEPEINLLNPVVNENISSTFVNFNFSVVDVYDPVLGCNLFVDGIVNASLNVNNDTLTNFSVDGFSQGYHNWSIGCQDDSGNGNMSAVQWFLIDRDAPTVELNMPVNIYNTTSDTIMFNWTAIDVYDSDMSCDLILDSIVNESSLSSLNNTLREQTINGINEGVHYWNVTCVDDSGNSNTSVYRMLRRDITPPSVGITVPVDYELVGWTVILRANVTDSGVGIGNVSYKTINDSNGVILTQGPMNYLGGDLFNASLITSDTWPYDSYIQNSTNITLIVYANDTLGNSFNDTLIFELDNSKPSIQHLLPSEDYFNADFNLNIWLSNTKLNYTNYTIYNESGVVMQINSKSVDAATSTWTDNVNASVLAEGNYSIYTYVKDYVGNDNNKSTWFYVDRTKPSISGWVDPTPVNDTYTIVNTHIINFTCSDQFLSNVWIDLNGSVNSSLTNVGDAYWWTFTRSEGTYDYTGYCNDTAGNINSTSERIISIDNSEPTWSGNITYPLSGVAYHPNQAYQFNVSWNDNYNIQSVLIEHNFTGVLINSSPDANSSGEFYINATNLARGEYQWKSYALDYAGNRNETSTFVYVVDNAAAIVNLTLNGYDANYTANQTDVVNMTAELKIPSTGYLQLYLDGVRINNGTNLLSNLTNYSNIGSHNVTIIYPATYNYSEGRETHHINVIDSYAPNITSMSPANNTKNPVNATFKYNVTDNISEIRNCSLYIGNILNKTNTSINKSLTQEFLVYDNPYMNTTWYIECFDSSLNNNSFKSEVRNITIANCTDYDGDGYWVGGCLPADCDDNSSSKYPGAPCSISCYSGSTYDSSCTCTGGSYTCGGGGGGGDDTPDESPEEPPVEEPPVEEPPVEEPPVEELPEEEIPIDEIIEEEELVEEEIIEEIPEDVLPPEEFEVLDPAEDVILVDPVTGEVTTVKQYSKGQIVLIKKATEIEYDKSNKSQAVGDKQTLDLGFKNKGNKALEEVSAYIDSPVSPVQQSARILHPRKVWGWDLLGLTGWVIEDYVRNPDLLNWRVSQPKTYKVIKPGEKVDFDLDYQSPLIKSAQFVDLSFKVTSRGQTIYEEKIPVQVNTTQFRVLADPIAGDNIVDVYLVVSNQENEEKEFNVELNINKKAEKGYIPSRSLKGFFDSIFKGPRTVIAEYYGPFKIPANSTEIYSYRYRYANELAGEYEMSYSLYEGMRNVYSATGEFELGKYQEEKKSLYMQAADYTRKNIIILIGVLFALAGLMVWIIEGNAILKTKDI